MPETAIDGSSPSELETPAGGALTGTDPAGVSTDADPAKSSGADTEGAKAPPTLLDVVKDVVKPKAEEGSPASKTQEGSPKTEATGDKPAEKVESDDASVPFHKHPRWQEKVASERKLKSDLETLNTQVTELKRSADQLQVIENFRTANGISPEEVVAGFKTMALIKQDPAKALPELRKIVSSLELQIGERLPPDLQEQVDKGAIDEASAKETARLRVANAHLTRTVDETRVREDERQVAGTREAIRSEVSKWEAGLKASDPDWSEKQDLVRKEVLAIVQETGKPPRTPEDALALAKVAYDEVNKTFARLRPPPRRTAEAPASGSSATGAKAQPKTLLDAARAALAA